MNHAHRSDRQPPRIEGEAHDVYAIRAAGLLKQSLGIDECGDGGINLAIEASGAPSSVYIGCVALAPA